MKHSLNLHLSKCTFFYSHLEYLEKGLDVLKIKVKALANIPRSKDVSQLRNFLELANYNKSFVANFNHIAKFLTVITQND